MGSIPAHPLSLSPPIPSPGGFQRRGLTLLPQPQYPPTLVTPSGRVSTSLLFFCAQESPGQQEKRRDELDDLGLEDTP